MNSVFNRVIHRLIGRKAEILYNFSQKRDKKRVNCQYFEQNFNKTGKKLILCNNSASIVEKITECNNKNLHNFKKFTNLIYFVIFI